MSIGLVLKRRLFYDNYEKLYGDGFYPQLIPIDSHHNICTNILFRLEINNGILSWVQINGSSIYGFEGIYGIQLLVSLNNEAKVNAERIYNIGSRCIYPKSVNTTFRLIDT